MNILRLVFGKRADEKAINSKPTLLDLVEQTRDRWLRDTMKFHDRHCKVELNAKDTKAGW